MIDINYELLQACRNCQYRNDECWHLARCCHRPCSMLRAVARRIEIEYNTSNLEIDRLKAEHEARLHQLFHDVKIQGIKIDAEEYKLRMARARIASLEAENERLTICADMCDKPSCMNCGNKKPDPKPDEKLPKLCRGCEGQMKYSMCSWANKHGCPKPKPTKAPKKVNE